MRSVLSDLPADQRPRERLRALGPQALALRELVSLLLGAGGPTGSALSVADLVLRSADGRLRPLLSRSPAELERIPGVGGANAARLLAAFELGRRAAVEGLPDRPRIRGPADVFALLAPRLRDLPYEEFHALLMNTQHRVLRDVTVTRGILDASLIRPREVFRPAITENAAAVILIHNHPSGDPSPSSEDQRVSRQMVEAGRAIGIRVLDHLIVADGTWRSVQVEE